MYNALVTGVGAVIGYGIIKSLRLSNIPVRIIGMDIYEDAYGRYICDKFIKALRYDEDGFIPFIKEIINIYDIDIVFLGTEQEILKISDEEHQLHDVYSKFVVNKKNIIDLSQDKWDTYNYFKNTEINVIDSFIESDTYCELAKIIGNKMLLKPRRSSASKGIQVIENEVDFEYYRKKLGDNFMVQPIIGDDEHEYTASVFGFGDGRSTKPIIFRRKLGRDGATVKACIKQDARIIDLIDDLVIRLAPLGPTNFQFREENEKIYLLEINPRISSATSIRTAFGYNEPEMCVEFFLENRIPSPLIKDRGFCVRYISDFMVEE